MIREAIQQNQRHAQERDVTYRMEINSAAFIQCIAPIITVGSILVIPDRFEFNGQTIEVDKNNSEPQPELRVIAVERFTSAGSLASSTAPWKWKWKWDA